MATTSKRQGELAQRRLALKKILRGENQFLPFALIDAIERATPLSVFSVANFNEYYCIAVKHDQIKLAAFTQPVLRQQAQTLLSASARRAWSSASLPLCCAVTCQASAWSVRQALNLAIDELGPWQLAINALVRR